MTLISARLPEVIDWADGLKDPIRITLPPPRSILRKEEELSSLFTLIVQGMLNVAKSILLDMWYNHFAPFCKSQKQDRSLERFFVPDGRIPVF